MDFRGITPLFVDDSGFIQLIVPSPLGVNLEFGSLVTIVLVSGSLVTIVLVSGSFVTIVLASDSFVTIVSFGTCREITVLSSFNGRFFPSASGCTYSDGCRGTAGVIAWEETIGDG